MGSFDTVVRLFLQWNSPEENVAETDKQGPRRKRRIEGYSGALWQAYVPHWRRVRVTVLVPPCADLSVITTAQHMHTPLAWRLAFRFRVQAFKV